MSTLGFWIYFTTTFVVLCSCAATTLSLSMDGNFNNNGSGGGAIPSIAAAVAVTPNKLYVKPLSEFPKLLQQQRNGTETFALVYDLCIPNSTDVSIYNLRKKRGIWAQIGFGFCGSIVGAVAGSTIGGLIGLWIGGPIGAVIGAAEGFDLGLK
jgi:hypothetical protein